jgi:diguanylate cyclase (GGDEF)-like protein/PAS domain S-box-containing protein
MALVDIERSTAAPESRSSSGQADQRELRTQITRERSGRPSWACWSYLGAGALLIGLYLAAHTEILGIPEWAWRFSIAMVINTSAAVALVVGIRRWRPEPLLAWSLLAVSQAIYALADFIFYWQYYIDHSKSYPSLADAFYLGRYPFIFAGLVIILRRRNQYDRMAMVDSLIIAIGVGVLSWVFLMEPYTMGNLALSVRLVALAYPLADLIMVVLVMYLLVGGRSRNPSFYILAGGLVLLVADDSLYGWRNLHGNFFSSGSICEIGWLVYYLTAGACALHPSVRNLSKPFRRVDERTSFGRIWALGAAALVGPVLLVSEAVLGRPVDAVAIGIGSFAIVILVVLRLTDVVRHLERSQGRFRSLAANAPIGIMETSTFGVVDFANERMAEIAGREVEALLGQGWIEIIHPEDEEVLMGLIEQSAKERTKLVTRFRLRRPDDEVRFVQISVTPKATPAGIGAVVSVEDVTKEVEDQEELKRQAFYDTLTGLPNRALFLDRLKQELTREMRSHSQIAVLFLDLDDFKTVNDSLGHDAGDAVLKEVGARFLGGVRAGETAARFGGDEFVFMIRDIDQADDAVAAAQRLLALLAPPIRWADQDLMLTASVGIVVPDGHLDATAILRDADTAMYEAKREGRNGYVVFGDDLHVRTVDRLNVDRSLHQALSRGEFEIYYQPVVEPFSGRPVGAEALIRWNHPTRGVVPPSEFIPIAEESGLIKPIGRWVFEQAVSQMAAWDADCGGPHLHELAINLSARQLADPGMFDSIRDTLQRYDIDPRRVCAEITETVMMADGRTNERSLDALRDLEIRVALDDFGTGYSSLAYLHTLPVTTVKVDRSFVERLGADDDSTPVVRAIIEMSHALGLDVVAEGVSSPLLVDTVVALGCDRAQGFHWARPMAVDQFAEWWLEAERRAEFVVPAAYTLS